MLSFVRPVALVVAAGLVVVPGSARADPAAPERRGGLDLEAHLGIVGSLCGGCDLNLGRTAGGALLYRAFPHFVVGFAGDALVFPYRGTSLLPGGTLYTGLIGLTMRGYLFGHGPVDGFVGLTIGGVPIKVSPESALTGSGQAGIEEIVGTEIHLARRLRVSTSVAFTSLLASSPDVLIAGSSSLFTYAWPNPQVPYLAMTLRVGCTFTLVSGRDLGALSRKVIETTAE